MKTFLSLPLELRNKVYDYAISDGHDIIADGTPPLYEVHPEITRELYSYRNSIVKVPLTKDSPWPDDEPNLFLGAVPLNLIEKFKVKKEGHRSLIVLLTAVTQTSTSRQCHSCNTDETITAMQRSTCATNMINSINLGTATKAMQWASRLMSEGVDARLDRRTVRTQRDPPWEEPAQGVDEHGMVWY